MNNLIKNCPWRWLPDDAEDKDDYRCYALWNKHFGFQKCEAPGNCAPMYFATMAFHAANISG